jgi:hypothetical protein
MKRPKVYTLSTAFALLAVFWVFLAMVLFIRSLNFAPWIYIWGLSSAISTFCLLVAIFMIRSANKIPVVVGAVGSATFFIASIAMMIKIAPIAQGNNDSGEVFWFLGLPMILTFVQASSAYLKLKESAS